MDNTTARSLKALYITDRKHCFWMLTYYIYTEFTTVWIILYLHWSQDAKTHSIDVQHKETPTSKYKTSCPLVMSVMCDRLTTKK